MKSASYTVPAPSRQSPHVDDVFARAALDIFKHAAHPETYTPVDGPPSTVQVIFDRATVDEVPGRESRVADRRTLAHLLVSEVGRPKTNSTITDGEELRKVDGFVSDDGIVVIVRVT